MQGVRSARKVEMKRGESSCGESPSLGVAEEEKQEGLPGDHMRQSLRDQFHIG